MPSPKYQDVVIRPANESDIELLVRDYTAPWISAEEVRTRWQKYYEEQQNNMRTAALLAREGEILGYGSLLLRSLYPHFADSHIPEICDLWIHEKYQRTGLGTKLISWLEALASKQGYSIVGIGVGLYADYGPAQKLYFKLGYAPDGNGITYKYQPTTPGETYPLDDELLLWLKKSLIAQHQ